MGYVLGVDLGTTYTAAAVGEPGGVEIFPLSDQAHVIPSVLVLREDGEVLVGEVAQRRAVTEPGRAAREFKRRLGDPTPLLLGGTPYGADALMAMLLKAVVAQVAQLRGAEPDLVCLTHPASYGEYKQDLLRQVAQQANVSNWVLITEPQAAAVNHAASERVTPGDVFAVYDLGGGTFDAAVVRAEEGGSFRLLGTPEGLERIGGIDFDQAVVAHVDAAVDGQVSELDLAEPVAAAAMARLRQECRQAKEALSSDSDVSIPVMLPSLSTEVRLRRPEFESMIRPRVDDTMDALSRAIRSAGLGVEDLTATLLVGGSSRIPLVRERVRDLTDRPVALDAHPKHSIALGAARLALADIDPASASVPPPPPPPAVVTDPVVVPAAGSETGPAVSPTPAVAAATPAMSAAFAETVTVNVPGGPPARDPSPPSTFAPQKMKRRWPLLMAAVVVLVGAAAGAFLLLGGDDEPSDDGGSPSDVASPAEPPDDGSGDPPDEAGGAAIVAQVASGPRPFRVAVTETGVWVTNNDGTTVSLIDPATNEVLATVDIGGEPSGVAATPEAAWVSNFTAGSVVRIDAASGELSEVTVGSGPRNVAITSDAVWVVNLNDNTVSRVDPAGLSVVNTIPVGTGPRGIAATDAAVWVTNYGEGTVSAIDPSTDSVVMTVDVGGTPGGIAITDDAVWVTDADSDAVMSIDPVSGSVTQTIPVGTDPTDLTTDGASLWVSNSGAATVTRIDLDELAVAEVVDVDGGPAGLVLFGTDLWVANSDADSVFRLAVG